MGSYSMRAVVITQPGGPEVLEVREVTRPTPTASDVLVRVCAAALNRADIMQREGRYPAPPGAPADIPGLEFAGEVSAVGGGAKRWRVGDRVFGLTGGGGYAEYLTAHEDTLARIPDQLDWSAAAAVPEAFITAHDALAQAEFRAGDSVLIHAVASGVGLAAVQLVRAMGGSAYGTVRHAEKLPAVHALGLAEGVALDADLAGLAPAVAQWSGGRGVDIVLDLLGGAYTAASVEVMASRGRLMLIGTLAGPRGDLPLTLVLRGRLTIKGTVLRARALPEKIAVTKAFERDVVPLLASGAVRPVIDSTFELAEVRAAHERMASDASAGKIVLRIAD